MYHVFNFYDRPHETCRPHKGRPVKLPVQYNVCAETTAIELKENPGHRLNKLNYYYFTMEAGIL